MKTKHTVYVQPGDLTDWWPWPPDRGNKRCVSLIISVERSPLPLVIYVHRLTVIHGIPKVHRTPYSALKAVYTM